MSIGKKSPADMKNFVSIHRKKRTADGKKFLTIRKNSCRREKIPTDWENFPSIGKNFLPRMVVRVAVRGVVGGVAGGGAGCGCADALVIEPSGESVLTRVRGVGDMGGVGALFWLSHVRVCNNTGAWEATNIQVVLLGRNHIR